MTLTVERKHGGLFNVVGAAYVPEQHAERRHHNFAGEPQQESATGIATIWLVLYIIVIGFSVLASVGATRWMEATAATFK